MHQVLANSGVGTVVLELSRAGAQCLGTALHPFGSSKFSWANNSGHGATSCSRVFGAALAPHGPLGLFHKLLWIALLELRRLEWSTSIIHHGFWRWTHFVGHSLLVHLYNTDLSKGQWFWQCVFAGYQELHIGHYVFSVVLCCCCFCYWGRTQQFMVWMEKSSGLGRLSILSRGTWHCSWPTPAIWARASSRNRGESDLIHGTSLYNYHGKSIAGRDYFGIG